MANFNQVTLLGNLTRDPELRYTPQGTPVCDLAIAVNRSYVRKDGEKVEETVFVDVTAWNRLAEVAAEFLKKGRGVLVSGHLVLDRWEDEASGQKRSKLRVVGESLQFLGGGSKDDVPASEEVPPVTEAPAAEVPPAAPQKGAGKGTRSSKSKS